MDKYLFHRGEHREAYNYMGARDTKIKEDGEV